MTRTLPLVLVAACGGAPAASPPPPAVSHASTHAHHRFDDAEAWARRFDDPARDAWQMPARVVELLAVPAGTTVVDLGAGTGYFEPYLARAVGPSGRVLALDVEPNLVDYMKARAAREGLASVEPRLIPTDDPRLADGSVSRVLVVDTWHHLEDRAAYTRKLARALAPGGAVFVVDFTLETDKGPPRDARLAPEQVASELRAGGLEPEIVAEPLPDQYIVAGRRR